MTRKQLAAAKRASAFVAAARGANRPLPNASSYVTRKVTKAACSNVDVVAPLKVRAFTVDTLDLNEWTNNREFMRELSDKRWNDHIMGARNA